MTAPRCHSRNPRTVMTDLLRMVELIVHAKARPRFRLPATTNVHGTPQTTTPRCPATYSRVFANRIIPARRGVEGPAAGSARRASAPACGPGGLRTGRTAPACRRRATLRTRVHRPGGGSPVPYAKLHPRQLRHWSPLRHRVGRVEDRHRLGRC